MAVQFGWFSNSQMTTRYPILLGAPSSGSYLTIQINNGTGGSFNQNTFHVNCPYTTLNSQTLAGWSLTLTSGVLTATANSNYTFNGITKVSGASEFYYTSLTEMFFNGFTSNTVTLQGSWTYTGGSGTTYTNPTAPTYVYIPYNNVNYSSSNGNPNAYIPAVTYVNITWTGAKNGTNNAITGFGVTEDGSPSGGSSYNNQHVSGTAGVGSTSGTFQTRYTTGGIGKYYKTTVRSEATHSNSSHSTSYVNHYPTAVTTYLMQYNANGGDTTPASESKYHGTAYTLAAAITKETTSSTSNLATITFNATANGGSSNPSSQTNTKTTTTSYTFDKWRLNSATGTSYPAGGSYTTNAAATFYATFTSSSTSSTTSITFPAIPSHPNGTATTTRTVTYDGNGGTPSTTSNSVSPTATITYTANKWWTTQTSGGTSYTVGAVITPTASTTYYARYSSSTGSYNNPSLTLATATRTGYTLNGWYTATSGGTKRGNGGASYAPSGNETVHAQWTANTYTVTLNKQDGTGGTNSVTATYAAAMPSATMPTRTGYTFGGYYDGTGGSGTQYYTAAGASARTWNKTAATTLYAKWTANTYTITLNANGGSGGTGSVSIAYNTPKGSYPSITKPTRTGYNFAGYYDTDAATGGTQWYDANGNSVRTFNLTAGTTWYARWTPRTYTVTVNLNGGTGGPGASFTATYGTNTSLAVPTKAGYDFVGWVAVNHGNTSGQRIGNLHYQAGGGLFTDGLPTKYLYGGSGTNNSTLSLVNADTTAGVYGSKMMRITEPGTSEKGVGWYSGLTSVANAKYIVCFVAKAPVGTYFIQANNSIGSGSSIEWITPQAGTGDWKTYAYKVNAGSSGTFSTFGHQVVCGNASSVSGGTNPGNVTVDVSCYVIYGNSMALNAGTNYIPSATATSDTIYALWIEKSYTISYNVNGGNALSTNTVINQSGSWREQLNPTSTFSNSRHQYAGAVYGGANSVANYSWFRVTRPTKADSVSSSTSAITTSYSAASAVTATGSTKTVTTTTPNNFYSWTITGMDSTTHRYWGRASASTTTNTTQSFSSTSITVTGTNYADGAPPMEFGNLRQTPGTVTFTAGWTNGTATTSTTYSAITLPNVPAKANTTSTITRTVSYNANGGSSTPSSQSVSPTAPITWTNDGKWYTTSALTTAAGTQGGSYTPQASGTLYAKYTSTTGSYNSPSLTLASAISKTATTSTATTTFNVNGGSGSNSSITNTVTQPYNFNKWAAGSTTGTQYSASSSFTPSADAVTMYATWTDGTKTSSSITTPVAPTRVETSSVTVSYNSDGGSSVSSSTSTKTDTYPFSGWALGSTTGATVSAGANINPTASTTYYAKWGTAAVTYSAVALPTTPTKAGYKLVGWTDGTTTYTTTYTPNSSSAVTLTAVWQQAGTVMIYLESDNSWHWAIPYVYKTSDSKWHQADAYIYKNSAWKKCGG